MNVCRNCARSTLYAWFLLFFFILSLSLSSIALIRNNHHPFGILGLVKETHIKHASPVSILHFCLFAFFVCANACFAELCVFFPLLFRSRFRYAFVALFFSLCTSVHGSFIQFFGFEYPIFLLSSVNFQSLSPNACTLYICTHTHINVLVGNSSLRHFFWSIYLIFFISLCRFLPIFNHSFLFGSIISLVRSLFLSLVIGFDFNSTSRHLC